MAERVLLGRASGARGEVQLVQRGSGADAAYELIVNGVFAMDSRETSSERAFGDLPFPWADARVLLGGLGLGYTAAELLDRGVGRLDVAEVEVALVDWARRGLTPTLAAVAADPRVRLRTVDVRTLLDGGDEHRWDAIVLDVDNGPDFLIHAGNAALYGEAGLRAACRRLAHGGLLAIWCQAPVPALHEVLLRVAENVQVHEHPVQRGERHWSYAIYSARRRR